jgi:hypothetical protein
MLPSHWITSYSYSYYDSIQLAISSFHSIRPEDGACSVCQNVEPATKHDVAKDEATY